MGVSRGRLILFIVVLMASMTSIIVLGLVSSGPIDVSELAKINQPTKVKVSGQLVKYYVSDNGEVRLILEGRDGFTVTAIINGVDYVQARIGSGRGLVVLEGTYYPDTNTIIVNRVLRGCHNAYSQASEYAGG